jgi:threonylcarbamoyladenosine tRNA methylthiotransferase MtaB
MQTVRFYTVGCKVNQYETQAIREQFLRSGFSEVTNGMAADIYLINTCTVTHKADRDCRRLINFAYRQNPKGQIIVTGCYTELDEEEITKIPGVTHIIKNKDKEQIVKLLNKANGLARQHKDEPPHLSITNFFGHTRAFLKIQDGCNNFCSYCKVPLVRGRSKSRPLDEIIQEANRLLKSGFKEIVLCGICLGSYGKDLSDPLNLVDVIKGLENIEGLLRIRLSSIEAGDVSDNLIQKIAQSKKLCRHLHIPMQSGDDEILKKMNRRYSRKDYLNLINQIKKKVPQIGISTDVLVGFPGETEKSFQNTVELIKKVMPFKTHIFTYSKRIGTAAGNFKDEVNPIIIKRRILRLKKIADESADRVKRRFLNKRMEVLIESQPKEEPNIWQGYTNNYIKVRVKSEQNLKNQLVSLKLKNIVKDYVLADFG